MKIPYIIKFIFNRYFFQKLFAILLLVLIWHFLSKFVFLFLVTFLFAYLFLSLWEFLHIKLTSFFEKKISNPKIKKTIKALIATNSIVLLLYMLFVWLIIFALSDLLPKIIKELSDLPKSVPFLSDQIKEILSKLEEIKNFKQDIKWTMEILFKESNYDIVIKFISNIKDVWAIIIEFVLSLILSYVFIIDRDKIKKYLEEVKKWNFAFLYHEYEVIFSKIGNGFWIIFKAQSLISLANTFLTIIWLYIIAWVHWSPTFPYMFTLAIIVFIFGMIPVLGMFLSSVPIVMIGFSFGGFPVVLECFLLIVVIHMIEAYYLNPRIVSSYAELPISLTFLILIISEQLLGVAWLLIWVPLFYIFLDLLKDFDIYIGKVKKANQSINLLKKETKENINEDIRLSRSGNKKIEMVR